MQEIIVYRNPMEAAFWNAIYNKGDVVFPIFVGVVVFCAIYIILDSMFPRLKWSKRYSNLGLLVSAIGGALISYLLWI